MNTAVAGRPRDPRVDSALREHLVAMLADHGPDGFSVDDLAARSGVSKAAIYRRFRCRDELIEAGFAAVNEDMPDVSGLPVRQAVIVFLEWIRTAVGSGLTASWLMAAQQMPQLHSLYMRKVVEPRREVLRSILRRGQQEGLIARDADIDVLLVCLSAPAVVMGMHRSRGETVIDVPLSEVVDTVLAGVLTAAESLDAPRK